MSRRKFPRMVGFRLGCFNLGGLYYSFLTKADQDLRNKLTFARLHPSLILGRSSSSTYNESFSTEKGLSANPRVNYHSQTPTRPFGPRAKRNGRSRRTGRCSRPKSAHRAPPQWTG